AVPARTQPRRQRQARGDGVDVDAERPELERQLARERNDAALGGGVGRAAAGTDPTPGDRRDVDDLPRGLTLHDWNHGVAEQKRAGQIEVQQTLPVLERQLVDRRRRPADDRAAAHGVDQNVDASVRLHDTLHDAVDLRGVQRVGDDRIDGAAARTHRARRLIERRLVVVHEKDGAALASDDLRGRSTDAAAASGDERDPSLESHGGGVYRTRRRRQDRRRQGSTPTTRRARWTFRMAGDSTGKWRWSRAAAPRARASATAARRRSCSRKPARASWSPTAISSSRVAPSR